MKRRKVTPGEALGHAPDLITLIRDAVQAARKDSPGGVRITPEEWLALGKDLGLLAVGVAVDALD